MKPANLSGLGAGARDRRTERGALDSAEEARELCLARQGGPEVYGEYRLGLDEPWREWDRAEWLSGGFQERQPSRLAGCMCVLALEHLPISSLMKLALGGRGEELALTQLLRDLSSLT